MGVLYVASVVVHVLAAMLWVGGMGAFAIVVVPAAKRALPESESRAVLRAAGMRLASLSPWILGTLAVTGTLNLHFRGVLGLVGTAAFWTSSFGTILAAKLGLVAVVTAASMAHARSARGGARGSMLGRAVLLLSIVVVVLAVVLVRGMP